MTQAKINLRLKSSNLQQTILAVKELVEHELAGEKWDVTVEINVKEQILPKRLTSKSTRVYTSHDWDAACDVKKGTPDPSLRAPWED